MVYAVIDTNVLVSARISKNPLAATVQVVASMFQNKIIPVYNEEQIKIILEYIKAFGIHSERVPYDGEMPDEKDRPFYEVSLSEESSFLVTGNLKHFPKTPKVVTAAQMMKILSDSL